MLEVATLLVKKLFELYKNEKESVPVNILISSVFDFI